MASMILPDMDIHDPGISSRRFAGILPVNAWLSRGQIARFLRCCWCGRRQEKERHRRKSLGGEVKNENRPSTHRTFKESHLKRQQIRKEQIKWLFDYFAATLTKTTAIQTMKGTFQ